MATKPSKTSTAEPRPGGIGPRERLEHRLVEAGEFCLKYLWVAALIWLAPAILSWPILHKKAIDYLVNNDLSMAQRAEFITWLGGSMLVMGSTYLAFTVHWRRTRGWNASRVFGHLNRLLWPLLPAQLLPVLLVPKIEVDWPKFTWVVILGLTATAFALALRGGRRIGEQRLQRAAGRLPHLATACALAIGALYAWKLSSMALLHHWNLRTQIYDLGIYDNLVWNTTFGEFLRCSFIKGGYHTAAHFDPILAALGPIYRLHPQAETLLVLQAVWLGTGTIPAYLIGRRATQNPWLGVVTAGLYALYPPLHGANLFDFHSLTLVVPMLLWGMYLIDRGLPWPFWGLFAVILATREDMSLLSCFMGLYVIVGARKPLAGLAIIFASLSWLVYVKMAVMPDSSLLMKSTKDTYSYIYFYADMIPHADEGAKGLIVSFFTNPSFVLVHVFTEEKLMYGLALLAPLCAAPLFTGRRVIPLLYGFVFLFLASRHHVYSTHFQYSAIILPFLIAATPYGIVALRERFSPEGQRAVFTLALCTAMGVSTVLAGMMFGILAENKAFRAGWEAPLYDPPKHVMKRYAWMYHKIREIIPPDASVSASSRIGPHVSSRAEAYRFPSVRQADYIITFDKDLGKKGHRALQRIKRRRYETITRKHGIEILRRRDEPLRPRPRPKDNRKQVHKPSAAPTIIRPSSDPPPKGAPPGPD